MAQYDSVYSGAEVDAAVDAVQAKEATWDSALQPTDFTNTLAEIDTATDKVQSATGTLLHTDNTPITPDATNLLVGSTSDTGEVLQVTSTESVVAKFTSNTAATKVGSIKATLPASGNLVVDVPSPNNGNAVFVLRVNAVGYGGGSSIYLEGVGRGYMFGNTLYGASFTTQDSSNLTVAMTAAGSGSLIRLTFTNGTGTARSLVADFTISGAS